MPAHFTMDSERRGHINRPTSLMGSVVGVKGNSKQTGMVSNGNTVNKYTNGSTGKQPLPPPPDVSNSNNSHSSSGKSEQRSSQKRGKGWLGLCYPSLGSGKGRTGAVSSGSESPSPTDTSDRDKSGKNDKEDGENSETDDESPTDGGFKIPNSHSNERPTSLPVALQLNSSRLNQPIIHGEANVVCIDFDVNGSISSFGLVCNFFVHLQLLSLLDGYLVFSMHATKISFPYSRNIHFPFLLLCLSFLVFLYLELFT